MRAIEQMHSHSLNKYNNKPEELRVEIDENMGQTQHNNNNQLVAGNYDRIRGYGSDTKATVIRQQRP